MKLDDTLLALDRASCGRFMMESRSHQDKCVCVCVCVHVLVCISTFIHTHELYSQEVSVFVFDKKANEIDKLPKRQREAIFELLKKGPTHLIKLRHPQVLTVEHQVEESK